MNSRGVSAALVLFVVATGCLAGCATRESWLQITSYRDPYFPESFRVVFDQAAYRVDPGGDHQIVARSTRSDAAAAGRSSSFCMCTSSETRPGKTHDDASGVDAHAVVVASTPARVFSDRFVYLRATGVAVAEIESGRCIGARVGNLPEVLSTRVTGH